MAETIIFLILLWHFLALIPSRWLRWVLLTPHYLWTKPLTLWYERVIMRKGWPKDGYVLDGCDLNFDNEVVLHKGRVFIEIHGFEMDN